MIKIINVANIKQKSPAIATVVNLGVSFLQRRVTENTEKPIEDVIPNKKPITEFFSDQTTILLFSQIHKIKH